MTLKEVALALLEAERAFKEAQDVLERVKEEEAKALVDLNQCFFGKALTLDQALGVAQAVLVQEDDLPIAKNPFKPRTIEAVTRVLTGQPSMNAKEVVKALEEKGWLPSSNEPVTYISFILTQTKTHFERDPDKARGYYRLVPSAVLQ